MKKCVEGTIAGLVYVNRNAKDYCEVDNLVTEWKKILSTYMTSRCIKCNTYEVHNQYFIAIEDVDKDTIETLNKCNITIYSIDYIVDTIQIRFKDENDRNLVFNVLKGEVE